jgi:hypothetical protein
MSEFSAEWLALREPADAAAREQSPLPPIAADPINIVDLGAGTGSNLRYLGPRLQAAQHWTLADRDMALLQAVTLPKTSRSLSAQTLQLDLFTELHCLRLSGVHLVTASALFDLVSREWILRLAALCRGAEVPACLFALNFNGELAWAPEEPEDAWIAELFRNHMARDKGFGIATGAGSAHVLSEVFGSMGYRSQRTESPWRLGPAESALQEALLGSYQLVAVEMSPAKGDTIADWARRRRRHIAARESRLTVGHQDVVLQQS